MNLIYQPSEMLPLNEPVRRISPSAAGTAYQIAEVFLGPDLRAKPAGSMLAIVANSSAAERLISDLKFFTDSADHAESFVAGFLSWEVLPFDALSPAPTVSAARIEALNRLLESRPTLVVSTVDALMQRMVPPQFLKQLRFVVRKGDSIDREQLIEVLDRGGYQRSSLVEEVGQYAVRGAVVDAFPPGSMNPIRIELFSGSIESVREFDAGTQRSTTERDDCELLPVRELFLPPEEADRETMFQQLRAYASDQGLPLRAAKSVEEALREGTALPGIEHLQSLFLPGLARLWDYLGASASVAVVDETAVFAAADEFEALVSERATRAQSEGRITPSVSSAFLSVTELQSAVSAHKVHYFDSTRIIDPSELPASGLVIAGDEQTKDKIFSLSGLQSALRTARRAERPFLPLAEEVRHRLAQGYRIGIVIQHPSRARRVTELLSGYDIRVNDPETGYLAWTESAAGLGREVTILHGELSGGIRLTRERVMLIPEHELFPESSSRRQSASARNVRRFLGAVSQLKEDDYIVHVEHGIGIYRGLRQIDVDGRVGDFLHLEYADQSKLFLPVENIGKIQKYAGADAKKPALSKLGGKAWSATKAKVHENVAELAGQLLKILAARELSPGIPFPPRGSEDDAFADSFPFEETPDQTRAIEEVLSDLSRSRPMDRLVCGDVGYGKTEVAIRAAFKAVNAGKQVALLVPTTILAEQHEQTFRNRFAELPFKIACVSRFNPPGENKRLLAEAAEGKVDILIGTHRLLQRDVSFRDLGLLIIDEEHRFGVAHKEKLKRLRAEVHVLTLTATPIPRTLHISLLGIRDLSIIETPPVNRQAIRTYLATYSNSLVREAIMREIGRSGQVFYIHNRVENIAAIADELAELVPEATIAFAHGQMKDAELEAVMHRFVTGEVNVLVSTTIIESGLDISNANTIIIRTADRFGLAELYQLRGRVGRSSRRAYAYLLISDPKTIGADAKKRLQALQSLDDLGIGFRLAIQDMEIRGAGNLLGKDQSGHIDLVGYELYTRILKEAVEELRRRRDRPSEAPETKLDIDPEVRIGFPAHIPPWYIPDVAERLLLYQRLIDLNDERDGRAIYEEMSDRFGRPPEEISVLIELMVFRGIIRRAGIVAASARLDSLSLTFHPKAAPGPDRIAAAAKAGNWKARYSASKVLSLELEPESIRSPKDLTARAEPVLRALGAL